MENDLKNRIDLLRQQEINDKEIFVLFNLKSFRFLRAEFNISAIEYAAWETCITYYSSKSNKCICFIWDVTTSDLFVLFGELNKNQSISNSIRMTQFEPCKNLPTKATIYEMEEVLNEYAKSFHQHLMSVINGEIWIDKLIR